MTPAPKRTLVRDPNYLKWIREQPCVVTGFASSVEAAHIRFGSHAGKSEKPGDDSAVPLDESLHRAQHNLGEQTFWLNAFQADPSLLAEVLQAWRHHEYRKWKEGR